MPPDLMENTLISGLPPAVLAMAVEMLLLQRVCTEQGPLTIEGDVGIQG